ncbi:chondroitin sulfate proteoglycan 4-like [Antedon mediterranea]|uniref:chondroitin sulfate proteoglycan 4-like n=1 Tax=Antedon mediterranea TaxID=105859 RepID=UPI003AF4FAF6
MTMDAKRLSCYLLIFFSIQVLSYAASFYGTSFIHLPLEDVSSENEISFQFRTSRTRGLLFMAVGQTDYCIIQIESSRIHVWMQVGSGEIHMTLDQKIKVNDLEWHQISIEQLEGSVKLSVDQKFSKIVDLPGNNYVFDVTDGIYIGGTSIHFNHTYSSKVEKSFRGCIENVLFNNIDVFQLALETDDATSNDITPNCSAQFVAAPNDPISFLSDTAYLQMPRWAILTRGSFACWLKTSVSNGLILYQGGITKDFIAVELKDGKVRTTFNRGSGAVDFSSSIQIDNSNWHYLIIEFTDTSISISVDYEAEVQELEADSEIFNMNEMMFIGGVVLKSRLDALQSGIHSITHSSRGGSFQGCIRDIEVNNQQLTLADTRVTHGVSMGCIYRFPCYDNPCKAEELCTDIGTENYECNCASQSCNADFTTTMDPTLYISQSTKTITTLPPVDVINEPISTKPVTLLEGGRVTITSNNIRLNIDLTLYSLRPSQILFRQQKPPKHGGLYRYVLRKNDKTEQFTLLDLSGSSKITYRHDGSEHFKDKIKLVLEVIGKNNLPEQFENAEFNLDVNVIPVNDPPKLLIPSDNILKIIRRSSIVLSSTELNANDPDTDTSNLTYSVLDSRKIGYVTVDNLRTKDFTQADVNAGRVFFVHTGPTNKSRVTLRVNDGFKYSRPVPLRIEAVPLELSVIHGTKLRVNPGNSVIITKENLDIESNANNQELDVSYEIVANPRYGEIQKNTNGNLWKKVNIFTQRHIDKHKLRYILNNYNYGAGRKRDAFSVRATCLDQTSEDIRVLVNILITEIRILNNTGLTLNKQRQGLITQESLSADVIDAPFPSPVRFNILRPPLKGHLLKNGDKIMVGQNFTQRDINNGIIEYKINDDVGQTINDSFLFQAFVSNAQSSHLKFNLSFVSEVGPLNMTNLGITVKEGASGLITAQQLYVSVEENEDFEFILTSTLQHGSLQLIDSTSKIVSRNISAFFNSDLVDGAVRYQHDHSEGFNDSFNFLASTSFVDQAGIMHEVQQPGYFNITVILINDHKPRRIVDKPFHVVRNGKKLLTNRDLKFVDDDINFDNADIEIRRQGIRNGQFVWVHDVETQVYRFRQRDIDEEKLLFKHNGVDEARMLLVVRDDDQSRLTTSYFKVIASDPFLTVTTNSELPVKHGATTTITGSYLQLETNMNIKDKNVVVDIVKPAVFGQILNLGSPVTSFTFEDMYLEKIEYQSTEQTNSLENLKDRFDFVVVSRDLVTDGSLTISIYVESHQVPPKIFKNKPFFVEQGKAVVLSKSNLRVYHENSLPGDIIFMVNKLPRYGILQLNSNRHTRKRRDAEFTFTQHDVNQGRVEYIQTKDAGKSQDTFTYDVNNGQSMLYNLTFTIEIAPHIIPLTINNITVKEGGSKAITPEIISIDHPYYEGDDYIIQLTTNPSHGILDHYRNAGVPITSFTKEDIQDEFVYYVHDGSNTLLDSFSFIANFTKIGKVSNTYKMLVNVLTVNDHKPNVLVNKGLGVIINSTAILSGDVLRTVDEDSGPNELVYTLTSANNGHLIMKGARNQSILTFTQQDLDEEKVIFVHRGSCTGGFPFHVTDGTHTSNRQIFSITAKELRIRLTSNQPFKVSTHSLKPITIDNMLVTANQEIQGYPITYVITQNPQHGEIVKLTSATSSSHLQVSQFTQNDISNGTICYLHTDIHNPAIHDSFRFDVFVPFSQNLTNRMVNITITPLQANESMNIHNSGLNVTEGEQVVIRVTNLFTEKLFTFPSFSDGKDENLKILYAVTELPNKGILKLNNIDMELNETFTNQNIEKNEITYVHDDSDTEKDFIKIKVALVDEQNLVVTSQSELINITITPVNDEMFEIVTKQLLMEVPQGAEYVVTKNDLQTIDQDTPPDQIVYKLLTQPTNGYITLKPNIQLHVMTFTQGDINAHDILFIQDGSTTPGAITFEVSDGAHKPLFKLLSVKVIPTTIDVMPGKDIFLLQGNTEIFLDRSNLNSTTNGNKLQLAYNITTAPKFGNFVMQGKIVTVFLQDDVDMELVQYVQWDLSVSGDSFSYVATVDETISQECSLNITVVPAFVLNSFNVTTEDTFQLSTDQISATKLQENTETDLIFTVVDNPAYGAIINASTSIQLSEFTFMDLTEGFVAVEMHHVDLEDNETLTDMYSLLVSSIKAQPVQLNGFFTIFPSPFQPTTEIFETTSFDTGSGTVVGPNFVADFDLSSVAKDIGTEEPLTTLPVYIKENIDNVPSDSSLFPIIIPIIIVIIAFLIIIFVVVLVVVKKKRKESNSGRESPYPDMDGGPYPGASTIPGRAGILPPLNVCAVNYSAASHEFPYNGSGSLHRPVASPAVPQVTVTALGRPPSPSSIKKSSMVSINSNGTGSLSYSLSHDSHGMHTPKLKKSQYWV